MVPGGLELGSTLAALMLAKPEAKLEAWCLAVGIEVGRFYVR